MNLRYQYNQIHVRKHQQDNVQRDYKYLQDAYNLSIDDSKNVTILAIHPTLEHQR